MTKLSILIATFAAFMLLVPYQLTISAYSPRHCKGFDVHFYASDDEAFEALMAGEVDFVYWPLTYEQYLDVCDSPDFQLAGFAANGIFQFDLNNNYTIADYPGIRNPLNDVEFRRALAQATDKDWIVDVANNGFAERIDCPLGAPLKGYANETCCNPKLYPYSLTAANARLDAAGFDDYDQDGTRNYPSDWSGKPGRPNLDPIRVCIRSDYEPMLTVGRALADNMRALGIPVNQIEATADVLFPIVLDARNYHVYTGYWSLGRYPMYLYALFHSNNWYPDGSNYVTGLNETNDPNYPDLDEALIEVYYAPNLSSFVAAVKKATGLLVCKYCVNIPLWSRKSWIAYSKHVVGVCNMVGCGLENTYTFLNAYKVDNPATPGDESQDPIRMGTINTPDNLNILYATEYSAKAVLDKMSDHLLQVNPYNLALDQPWIAQDWEEATWYDPQDDENKTKVTYYIRKDVWWHAPVTGEAVQKFTAYDVEFSIWYIYSFMVFQWGEIIGAENVHHTNVIDDYTIEVYFDERSMFADRWIAFKMPLLKKHALLDLLCKEEMCEFPIVEARAPSDKDVLPCGSIVQIINVTKYPEEEPLIEGVDYEIFGTIRSNSYYCHNEIHWLRPLASGETVVFWYWTPDLDPHGYYLANLPWQQTFYSLGPYYAVDIDPGNHVLMNCVDSHWLGAPKLGEIDWTWYWDAGPTPRTGYYQVNLYDAVTLLRAYCTRGDQCPVPSNWFPGADIDPYDLCHVGLHDAVQLLTNYGRKFGIPPLEDP